MAAQQLNPMEKRISLKQISEDLNLGLSKWKKDDIGFGSIEKKYNLTLQDAMELFNHPKIKKLEARVPKLVIVDDLPDYGEEQDIAETVKEVRETGVVLATPSVEVVKVRPSNEDVVAFI